MLIAKSRFECVVVRINDGFVGCVFSVVWPLTDASSLHCLTGTAGVWGILSERAAAWEAKAESGISWVHRDKREDVMTLVANVADGQQCVFGNLPLDRKHVVIDVRYTIAVVEKGIGGDGQEIGPINGRVWIGY